MTKQENINIFQLEEKELRQYAHECMLYGAVVDTLVYRVIEGYTWAEIARNMNVVV
ncbi:MAG: hypothetical protein LBU60_01945 [Clostridiales bacterium]|jgi:uncharacterized protein (DUF2132 family)|nr:hypothetical protein [Clostridiales bacterium]